MLLYKHDNIKNACLGCMHSSLILNGIQSISTILVLRLKISEMFDGVLRQTRKMKLNAQLTIACACEQSKSSARSSDSNDKSRHVPAQSSDPFTSPDFAACRSCVRGKRVR